MILGQGDVAKSWYREKRTNTKFSLNINYQKLLEETKVRKHAYNDKNWNILPYPGKEGR